MSTRKRSGSWSKKQLKGKVVQMYELLLRGEDLLKSSPTFWDELFLLKPKLALLDSEIQKLTSEQLLLSKENVNTLFHQCVETLSQEPYRVAIALQTLCVLVHSMYKKVSTEANCDIISLLIGGQNVEKLMQMLLNHCQTILSGEHPDSLKALSLKLLLVFITGTENVSENTLIEYIMLTSLFESLIKLLCDTTTRQIHGYDVVLLLTLLVNYRKHESANPYIVKLSIVDDELVLSGYGQVITASLTEFCKQFVAQQSETQNASWFSSLTNRVGNMFISEEEGVRTQKIRANNALLLALYEAIHLNRNFITTLAQMQTDTSSPPSPSNTLSAGHSSADLTQQPVIDVTAQPSNLLVTFFQYCSIVMQDTKTDAGTNTVKLCFIILSCIAEDQYANSLMHDVSLTFKVQLHRMPMRHQKPNANKAFEPQPLVCILLDLLVEFIISHKMKKLPMELYLLAIGIIHRLLVYQKRFDVVRINYKWGDLWEALTSLLKFLIQNESNLTKKMNIFDLCLRVVNILNFFITYGDTFLPTPGSYDELYYELIRTQEIFMDLDDMCLRYETSDSEFKLNAQKLNASLINIRAIRKHFRPKIDEWLKSQHLSTPSEEQILDVVKANYGSLLLKLQDSLEQYERYSEKPAHTNFFVTMVKCVVANTRFNVDSNSIDTEAILEEYTSIL